ncbi:hemerythrin domain-containing protein [Photobacterium atrarenae]|uniref:Hemerythrin domain-containing protein n=1 Tax=Photobacterium atrarenae TaxID=865757 RepID=A0ABY5GDJ1_9GAMM|nr:hemerythrin domain-containing protein [Photobacterium atrarenae]UTV27305.1 hemerythrin domain-containing protein [Photobacterium atrarenae]
MMLESIHTEHGYMMRLLNILRQKLAAIQQGKDVNYQLLKDIVEYLQKHAECCHHPKEDLLYRYYQSHYDDCREMKDLELEHTELARLTQEFSDTVDMILMDAVIPLDVFADKLNIFVQRQIAHLEFEEKHIFPLIRNKFTAQDWVAVSAQYEECACDPLFGDQVSERYRGLAERLNTRG